MLKARWRGLFGGAAGVTALVACVGDDPDQVTPGGADAGGVDGAPPIGADGSSGPSDGGADALDPGPDGACPRPGNQGDGGFCDDFDFDTVTTGFWGRRVTAGAATHYDDPTAPSPPGSIFISIPDSDAGAAATIFHDGRTGATAMTCRVAVDANLADNTTVRLLQLTHRSLIGGAPVPTRTAAVVVTTFGAQPMIGAYVAAVDADGHESGREVGLDQVAFTDRWQTIELHLAPRRAVAKYAEKVLLEMDLPGSDPESGELIVGLSSIDGASKASSARYDNVRCTELPP